jgi:hypothetical protein
MRSGGFSMSALEHRRLGDLSSRGRQDAQTLRRQQDQVAEKEHARTQQPIIRPVDFAEPLSIAQWCRKRVARQPQKLK